MILMQFFGLRIEDNTSLIKSEVHELFYKSNYEVIHLNNLDFCKNNVDAIDFKVQVW